jgi:hypothetical protein
MVKADRFLISQEATFSAEQSLTPMIVHSQFSAEPFVSQGTGEYPILGANEERAVYFKVVSPSSVQVIYDGQDPANGKELVKHYVSRLRKNLSASGALGVDDAATALSVMNIRQLRAIWRADRLVPLAQYLLISLLAVVIIMAVAEFSDESLKSERKAAQYLKVPMLGSLPDMNRFIKVLGQNTLEKAG